jgi:predicted transport protein
MVIFQDGKKFQEYRYSVEDELEREIVDNSQLFFGKHTIYIDAKRKIESKALGGTIPDGFLFDLSDKEEPEFYVVEVELKSHDFFNHIFPQITKFFAFFKNRKSQAELVEKIFSIVNTDMELKKEFKKYLGEKEIYKSIKDTIDNSQNILLVIDDKKDDLPEIMETYSDTWGKMVKVLIFKKFVHANEFIYVIEPDFENIEYGYAESVDKAERKEIEYTEEFHLEGIDDEIKAAYFKIKENLLKINKDLVFNPQKYYISIIHNKNIAFFQFRKKKIRLVVMSPEDDVRLKIKNHNVKHLSEGVQKFWNGPSCEIIIDNKENMDEIINLLKSLIKENKNDFA